MLEKAGLDPIIYEINMTGLYEPFVREGRCIKFEGIFPCDENGNVGDEEIFMLLPVRTRD